MNPEYRRYLPADRDAVVHILQTVLPDDQPHNEPVTVLRQKLAKDDLLFVAEVDGTINGFVMAGFDGHRGWIYSLAVLPECRNLGLGRGLVNQCLVALEQLGCRKVNLQVREGNEQVISFYERLGFSVEPRTSMGLLI